MCVHNFFFVSLRWKFCIHCGTGVLRSGDGKHEILDCRTSNTTIALAMANSITSRTICDARHRFRRASEVGRGLAWWLSPSCRKASSSSSRFSLEGFIAAWERYS
jgi:hypothetical protein